MPLKSQADPQWDRLAAAMLDARDNCRRIHELAERMERSADRAHVSFEQIKQLAAESSDRLRMALKRI